MIGQACCNWDDPCCGVSDDPCCQSDDPCCNNPDLCCGVTCTGDGNPCTEAVCVEGACETQPVSGPCSDGNPCTENDTCEDRVCVGTPKNCDDGNLCTNDHCDVLSGDCYQTQVNCGDGVSCTMDCCDPETGCQHYPSAQPCSVRRIV